MTSRHELLFLLLLEGVHTGFFHCPLIIPALDTEAISPMGPSLLVVVPVCLSIGHVSHLFDQLISHFRLLGPFSFFVVESPAFEVQDEALDQSMSGCRA